LDIGCFNGEPGYEYREDLDSLKAAAAKGGYTHLAPFPTSSPTVDTKGQVQYLLSKNTDHPVKILPIASLSAGRQGKDLAELIDLSHAGAVAFSDGKKGTSTSLLERGLQYLKGRKEKVIHVINTKDELGVGQINEGKASVYLGLPGLPEHKEIQAVEKAIAAARYTEGDILIHNISLEASLTSITKAKKTHKNIDVSVAFMNLIHSEDDLLDFDANKKVLPPMRMAKELKKLSKGVTTGQITVITSNHTPRSKEEKDEPFGQSAFGASSLASTFTALVTHSDISTESIISCLSDGPYRALGLEIPLIANGEVANLTLFDPTMTTEILSKEDPSLSNNNPYHGHNMTGRVLGIVNFDIFKENWNV